MIAIVTMLIDHSAKALIYNVLLRGHVRYQWPFTLFTLNQFYRFLRGVGRLAFPIFCFCIVEGFIHTRSRRNYVFRLLIFGLISEIPFNLGIYERLRYPSHQNVMFELALGVIMLTVWEKLEYWDKIRNGGFRLILQALSASVFLIAAQKLHLDYGYKGLALILLLYLLRFTRELQCAAGALIISIWEWPAVFSFALLALYNGKRGRNIKYFFYVFYPAHLLLLGLLTIVLKNRL